MGDLFIDARTKKIDGSKFRMTLAFFITSWVMVYSTLNDKMTEWLFLAYIAAWITDRKFSRDNITKNELEPEKKNEDA